MDNAEANETLPLALQLSTEKLEAQTDEQSAVAAMTTWETTDDQDN